MGKYDVKDDRLVPKQKHLKTFPADEPLVSMVVFKETIYVASTKSVYKLIDDEFYQMEFVFLPDDKETKS